MIDRRQLLGAAVAVSAPAAARAAGAQSIVRFGAVPGRDCRAAIQAAADAGDQVLIPPGDWQASSGIAIPKGVDLVFAARARIVVLNDDTHLFSFAGGNKITGARIFDPRPRPKKEIGTAALNVTEAADVTIEDVQTRGLRGDVFRIADTERVAIRRGDVACARNILTLNDDIRGTTGVVFEDIKATSWLNGFQAESDDSEFIVQDVAVRRFRFRSLVRDDSYGVAFTKSAKKPSSFAKYRRIAVSDVTVEGAYCGAVIRGADGVAIDQFVARDVDEGLDIGAGSTVRNLQLSRFSLDARKVGVVVRTPKGAEKPAGIHIGPGTIKGRFGAEPLRTPDEGVTVERVAVR